MLKFKQFSDDGMKDTAADELAPLYSLLDIASGLCRWPYDDQLCCGREVHKAEASYCAEHHRRAHKPRANSLEPSDDGVRAMQANERKQRLPRVLALAVLDLL